MKTSIRLALYTLILATCLFPLLAQTSPQPENTATALNTTGTHGDVILDGDAQLTTAGVVLRAKSTHPSVAAQTGSTSGGFVIFNSANAELLRVRDDGNVGIGTAAPRGILHLVRNAQGNVGPELLLENNFGTVGDASALTYSANLSPRAQIRSRVEDNTAYGTLEFRTGLGTVYERMRITGSGNVGIGIYEPYAHLHVNGTTPAVRIDTASSWPFSAIFRDIDGVRSYGNGVLLQMLGTSEIHVSNLEIGYALIPRIQSVGMPLYLNPESANDVVVGSAAHANTGLKVQSTGLSSFAGALKVTGNLTVDGDINVKYQDLAEWVPSESDLDPGTVVVLSRERANAVTAATKAYDTSVAGVVSAQPGLVLGERGLSKEMVATTGRVRVKVDATRHPIAIGDLLVSSDKPGLAMKSEPLEIAGQPFHRPGTIIGKALEPLAAGTGEILVLLSLQ